MFTYRPYSTNDRPWTGSAKEAPFYEMHHRYADCDVYNDLGISVDISNHYIHCPNKPHVKDERSDPYVHIVFTPEHKDTTLSRKQVEVYEYLYEFIKQTFDNRLKEQYLTDAISDEKCCTLSFHIDDIEQLNRFEAAIFNNERLFSDHFLAVMNQHYGDIAKTLDYYRRVDGGISCMIDERMVLGECRDGEERSSFPVKAIKEKGMLSNRYLEIELDHHYFSEQKGGDFSTAIARIIQALERANGGKPVSVLESSSRFLKVCGLPLAPKQVEYHLRENSDGVGCGSNLIKPYSEAEIKRITEQRPSYAAR